MTGAIFPRLEEEPSGIYKEAQIAIHMIIRTYLHRRADERSSVTYSEARERLRAVTVAAKALAIALEQLPQELHPHLSKVAADIPGLTRSARRAAAESFRAEQDFEAQAGACRKGGRGRRLDGMPRARKRLALELAELLHDHGHKVTGTRYGPLHRLLSAVLTELGEDGDVGTADLARDVGRLFSLRKKVAAQLRELPTEHPDRPTLVAGLERMTAALEG